MSKMREHLEEETERETFRHQPTHQLLQSVVFIYIYLISYFLRMISEAPLLYMRKPPSAFFSTVLIDFREELKV